jgi:hypothetical protein
MKGHCAIRENEPRFTHLAAAGPHNPKYKTAVNAPTYEEIFISEIALKKNIELMVSVILNALADDPYTIQ